jgi:hypothetical protein
MSGQCQTNLHLYLSRWRNISTPFPTLANSEQRVANLFPWWAGHWPEDRGVSYVMPSVQYPEPQLPRGVLDAIEANAESHNAIESSAQQCLITPNWALPTRR